MPLIVMSGLPCSGKTTRALQAKKFLEKYLIDCRSQNTPESPAPPQLLKIKPNVILINEEALNLDRTKSYSSSEEEKKCRGAIISAVERTLSREDIVVCDAMNYIKGFRYQLYCVARALGTPHCVMYCGISKDKAREWNTARQTNPEVNGYDSAHFEELIMRFEEPEARNRWDSPLFTVIPDDGEGIFDAKLGQEIVDAVILRKPPAPNLSTVVKPLTETNYLYEMDRMTQDIINAISAAQRDSLVAGVGGQIAVPYTKSKVTIPPSQVTMSELRRLRRQYCQINKLHTQIDKEKVASGFVDYLNTNLGS